MSGPLQLRHEPGAHVDVLRPDGGLLWRYVYAPATPANEARRPYAHPVCSFAGDVLTNFRPNDHPWHHALSLTLTSVEGVNFWGGPSYRAGEGYRWRDDAGEQRHEAWLNLRSELLEERVAWLSGTGERLLEEQRRMETTLEPAGWSLRWTSELRNVTGRELVLGNYHATHGLLGSHYTGLQFRGARDLLDDHGDATIGELGQELFHGIAEAESAFFPHGQTGDSGDGLGHGGDGEQRVLRHRLGCVGPERADGFVVDQTALAGDGNDGAG